MNLTKSENRLASRRGFWYSYQFLFLAAGVAWIRLIFPKTQKDKEMLKKLLLLVGGVMYAMTLPLMADFTFGGDAPWMQDASGIWRSGSISDGQSSTAEMVITGPAAVSFKWKTSSEGGYDKLIFSIDGSSYGEISGEMTEWEKKGLVVTDGEHSLKWTYCKDGSASRGEDCGWIKDVTVSSSILYFTGTLNANGGVLADGTESNTVENLVLVDLPEPTRLGYTFLGWFTAADGGNEVTIATAIASGATLYAHWEEITYIYNYIDNGDGTVTLSRYDEYGNWVDEPIKPTPIGEFIMPGEIGGKRVVSIEHDFFDGFAGMTSIVIPSCVTNVDFNALSDAYDLTNITVAVDNPAYKSVDGIFYSRDGKRLITCPRKKGGDVVVALGTEYIEGDAFYLQEDLTSVSFPDGLKVIESSAFFRCTQIVAVTIPASVVSIRADAFRNCSNLATVNFLGQESDIDIADTAFVATPYDATKPFGLIVDRGALFGIHGTAPENLIISNYLSNGEVLTVIENQAFSASYYNTSSMTNIVVPEGVTGIYDQAFADNTALESISLPATLQYIYYGVFSNCSSLRKIRIPVGVTYVDYYAFAGCENLTVYAPRTLEGSFVVPEENGCQIEYYEVAQYSVTFNANDGTVEGESTVDWTIYEGRVLGQEGYNESGNWGRWLPTPTLDGHVFLGWFTAATGGDEVTAETVVAGDMTLYAHWEEITYTYNYIDNGDGTVTISCYDQLGNWVEPITPEPEGDFTVPGEIDGKRVVAIGNWVFMGITSLTIPASVTNMPIEAFYNANGLTNIAVAADNPAYKSVDGILYTKDGKTLVKCPRDKSGDITVAAGTEIIGARAFDTPFAELKPSRVSSVVIPDTVKVIQEYAFYGCNNENFTVVTVPDSVEAIGAYAFGNCTHLATVNFLGLESDIDIAATAFVGTPYDAVRPFALIVENGTLIRFQGTAPENLVIADHLDGRTLTGIGQSAFYQNASLTNVVVPEGVKWIGDFAFAFNAALINVALPTSLQSIGTYAFEDCTSLRAIRVPSGVTWVSGDAFWNCQNLTVYAPETLRGSFSVPDTCTIEYYAVPQYTVTFNANGGAVEGESTATWSIYEGRFLGYDGLGNSRWLPTPTLDGHIFLGWFTAAEGGDEVTAETVVTGDVTLYAHWMESPFSAMSEEYPWTVDVDGNWRNGNVPAWTNTWAEVTVEGPCKVSFSWMRVNGFLQLIIDGQDYYLGSYEFGVWQDSAISLFDGGMHTVRFQLSTSLYYDQPLTGLYCLIRDFKAIPGDVCTISLNPNGGVWKYDYLGDDIKVIGDFSGVDLYEPTPTSQTIEFAGWWTSLDDSGEEVTQDTPATGNMTIYAHWRERESSPEWYYDVVEDEYGNAIGISINGFSVDFAGHLDIPASIDGIPVVAISEWAFNRFSITSVTIPDSVTNIGDYAFYSCKNLATVTFDGDESAVEMNKFIAFARTPWLPRPANDEYEDAQPLGNSSEGSTVGTLQGATITDNDCIWRYGDAERTVWYKWVAPFTGKVIFTASAENGQSDLLYLVATRGYDEENGEWDDCGYNGGRSVAFEVEEGETYYVSLATWNYVVSGFTLSWQPLVPPGNDDFATAASISGTNGSVTGTNWGASVEGGEPLPLETQGSWTFNSTATVWWRWTAPANGTYAFKTQGSDFDTVLGVYTGNSVDALVKVAANDQWFNDTSAVAFDAIMGTTYFIAVGGYANSFGGIVLSWAKSPFTFGGDAPWMFEEDGSWRSGRIESTQTSSAEMFFVGPASVSFKWKTFSNGGNGRLRFAIDADYVSEISGDMPDWEERTYTIESGGEHALTWVYSNVYPFYSGEDCGWIKDIVVTPLSVGDVVVEAGENVVQENGDGFYVITPPAGGELTAVDVETIAVKTRLNGEWVYTTAGYDIVFNGGVITVSLKKADVNVAVDAALKDPGDKSGFLVVPSLVPVAGVPVLSVGETLGALPVDAVPGLWYQASWGANLGDMTDGVKVQATSGALYLGVVRQNGTSGFYGIKVTDK